MVATDTVVGIVGAVLLVAVMAGVFAYEYNNPVDADAGGDAGQRTHFESDYGGLSAGDDIDGDGHPNYLDDDIDGDGKPNAQDDMVAVEFPVSGSLGTRTTAQTPFTLPFSVGNGTEHLGGTITYTRTGAAALGLPTFAARVVDSGGSTVTNAASTTSGNAVTLTFDFAEPLVAGTYSVEVSQPQPGPGGSFSGTVEIHYASPAAPKDHGFEKA